MPQPSLHQSLSSSRSRRFGAIHAPMALLVLLLSCGTSACSRDAGSAEVAGAPEDSASGGAESFEEPPRNVRVLTLETGDLAEYLVLSGALRPARGADIASEETGVVASVLRDKGAYVQAGEAVLALDTRILEAQKRSAEAAETLHSFNEERTRKLFEENSVSGQEMLGVHTQAEQARAEAAIARTRLEKAAFPAPFAGIVAERFVEVGELVAPGTRVARIIDPFRLELVGSITEREVPYINQGASVTVVLEGLGEQTEGEVTWVGFEADPMTGKFPVEITIGNRDLKLRPGLLGRARIEKQEHVGVLAIPRDAILNITDGTAVFVADEGRARRRMLELGIDQGLMVEVRSGLSPGDELIVRGHRDLADGTPIQIQERATSPDGSLGSDPNAVRQAATRDRSLTEEGSAPAGGIR